MYHIHNYYLFSSSLLEQVNVADFTKAFLVDKELTEDFKGN